MVQSATRKLRALAVDFWDLMGPGGKLHPQEFIEHHGDVLVQLLLVAVSAYLLLQNRFKPSTKQDAPFTEQASTGLYASRRLEGAVICQHDDGSMLQLVSALVQ